MLWWWQLVLLNDRFSLDAYKCCTKKKNNVFCVFLLFLHQRHAMQRVVPVGMISNS